MSKKQYTIANILLALIGVILLFELIRDSSKTGDFWGYVTAGYQVLLGENIYDDPLNTWPPFFSVFCIILALGEEVGFYFVRFIWLLGNLISVWIIISLLSKLVFQKPFRLRRQGEGIMIQDTVILVPLLIMLRYIMENMMNVQINLYMLLCSLLSVYLFTQKKYCWAGMLLGLTISLKVYTIFFLFYFLFKREFKMVGWTMLFVIFFNLIPLPVFGLDQYINYYSVWINEVAPMSFLSHRTNQSLLGMMLRFLTSMHEKIILPVNILELDPGFVKKLTYALVCVASVYPAYLFRKKLNHLVSTNALIQYSLVFTLIPLLSPVSWKAYFIFLWVPYFLLYALLYRSISSLPSKTLNWLKTFFILSFVCTVFSSELFIGIHLSDVLEEYSIVTIGTLILVFVQVYIGVHIQTFDLSTVAFSERTLKK